MREEEFGIYLEWCMDIVGDNGDLAKGLFLHAGILITYPPNEN